MSLPETWQPQVRDLCRLLDKAAGWYNELSILVERKVEAMRRADMSALQEARDQEMALVKTITELEGLRRTLMDKIGCTLGMATGTARVLTVSQLCQRLPAEGAKQVSLAAGALREAVAHSARVNRLAGVVAGELVNHLRWVWRAARPLGERRVGYTHDGGHETNVYPRVFDTTG
ncbi:MAG: flagellar export chaperone FlgN [Phycisphaerae bacterium]